MKLNLIILLATSLILSSCLTPAQKDKLASNLAKDGKAALVGGLTTGTWAGATDAAIGQALKNNLTAPKNPVVPVTPK